MHQIAASKAIKHYEWSEWSEKREICFFAHLRNDWRKIIAWFLKKLPTFLNSNQIFFRRAENLQFRQISQHKSSDPSHSNREYAFANCIWKWNKKKRTACRLNDREEERAYETYRIKNDKRNKMENIYYLMPSAFFMCVAYATSSPFVLEGANRI